MLACATKREKRGECPSSSLDIKSVYCDSRGYDSITLAFRFVDSAGGDIVVSKRDVTELRIDYVEGGLFSRWKPVAKLDWWLEEADRLTDSVQEPSTTERRGGTRCVAVVSGMPPESDVTMQITVCGWPGEDPVVVEPVVFRTADRPAPEALGSELRCLGRRAHGLMLEWLLPDPEGSPVEECEVQYRTDSFASSWQCCRDFRASDEKAAQGRRWSATLGGLDGATSYRLRGRARNAVGWSLAYSPELLCRTSELPCSPSSLTVIQRGPHTMQIGFHVDDPEGAPVLECTADMPGVLGFKNIRDCKFEIGEPLNSANFIGPSATSTVEGRCANVTLEGLLPETSYGIRVWARNESGWSRDASLPLQCRTSERPLAPALIHCTVVGPRAFVIEWEVADPAGAPVLKCELEYSRDSVFASWVAVEAQCLEVEGECPRRYWVRLENLERESPYLLRARAQNIIGWSIGYSPTVAQQTTDRPPTPEGVTCVERLPGSVKLEFTTTEIPGTALISSIHVENGLYSWQEMPTSIITREPRGESESGITRWVVSVTLGISPGLLHALRVWAANEHGWSREASPSCTCRTSDQPDAPGKVACIARAPHTLELEWWVPEPEGAPVWHCEVQCSEDSSFSSWRRASCADAQRQPLAHQDFLEDPARTQAEGTSAKIRWRCTVERLHTNTSFLVRVRARNEVGWSQWSDGLCHGTTTSGPPGPARGLCIDRTWRGSSSAGSGYLTVRVSLDEPEGAPIVTCVILWRQLRMRAIGERFAPGRWRAHFPLCDGAPIDDEVYTFGVLAANAVGWGACAELSCSSSSSSPAGRTEEKEGQGVNAAAVVLGEVKGALTEQGAALQRLLELVTTAESRNDPEYAVFVSTHQAEVQRRLQVLQSIANQVEAISSGGGEAQGTELVSEFQASLREKRLMQDVPAAGEVVALLLRGCLWLESVWRAELGLHSEGVAQLMSSVPESGGRLLKHWASQHHSWSQGFDEKISATLPDGLASAAQILTALVSLGNLNSLEGVRRELENYLELVSAAERQLRRLRQSRRVLQAAQGASCHNFEPPTVSEKIERTAISLITTTVLAVAVPGATECGAARIGMLWLEGGDGTAGHLALEHPAGAPLQPLLQRLGWSPPPSAAVVLAGWAGGGHRGVVLFHNLTARRITVGVRADEDPSLGARMGQKLSESHPMVRAISQGFSDTDKDAPGITVLPTDVALIQVPDASLEKKDESAAETMQRTVRLIFSYGSAAAPEQALGWARVRPGSALSFVCLDGGLQVSNHEEGEEWLASVIEVVNHDLAPVTVSVFRAPEARKYFESPFVSEVLQPSEKKELQLPMTSIGRVFQVEIVHSDKHKSVCEVRPGQRVSVERYV